MKFTISRFGFMVYLKINAFSPSNHDRVINFYGREEGWKIGRLYEGKLEGQ